MRREAIGCGWLFLVLAAVPIAAAAAEMGKFSYDDFQKPGSCKACHRELFDEWEQSLMSQAFTHEWDQIEYFKLALPQALALEKVSGVKAGCIACHAPLAFLAGDIPPKPASEGTRANEGVSCDICHTITGSSEAVPYNGSYIIEPGRVKLGQRADAKSPAHGVRYSEFTASPELCATCHDEQSPYGAWVKATYREWKAGPYAKEGTRCQDCHMYRAPGRSAMGGKERQDVAHHNFHGSHFQSKLAGAVDVAVYTQNSAVRKGSNAVIQIQLFNGKAGHSVPSGSTEERMLWIEVRATDSQGKSFSLPVDRKGFPGEEFTIADSGVLAYQAMGEIMGNAGFPGVKRDGNVPDGSRIFRHPFFDPMGRMTICQWYTAENTKVDYRIGPRETKIETYTWKVPEDAASGPVEIEARLFYSQVPSSVGEYLGMPAGEYAPLLVNAAGITLLVE